MFDSLFNDTLRLVKKWKSKKEYSKEPQYRDDLMIFLREKLNNETNVLGFSNKQRIKIVPEDGRGLIDIGINDQVGIELKKDLNKKSEIDRLYGQISRYKTHYKKGIIIVLVGKTKTNHLEDLKYQISELSKDNKSFGLGQTSSIIIVDKGYTSKKEQKPKSALDWLP